MLQQHHKEPDGYRGLAILTVVLYHYFDGLKIFRAGWIGVDLFFTLSAFLITGRLLETYAPQKKWTGFWVNRFLRIVPPLLLLFIVYFLVFPMIAPETIAHDIRVNTEDKWWYFSFTQNWLYVRDGYPAVPHLAYLWSLAVQVQFYVILFIIIRITRNPKYLLVIFLLLGFAAAILRTNMSFEATGGSFAHYMYNTFTRMDTFAGGVVLYCLLAMNKVKQWQAGLLFFVSVFLLAAIFFMRKGFDFTDPVVAGPGILLVAPAATTLLYFMFVSRPQWLGRIARSSVLVFTGRISYGLYLFHIPVFLFLSGRLYGQFVSITGTGLLSESLAAAVCLAISFTAAWFSYRFMESKILAARKNDQQD